jgi:hypothetical protein
MHTTLRRRDQDNCPEDGRNGHIKIRVLHDACVKLGGEAHLAAYLGMPLGTVHSWLMGQGEPSDNIFLKCLDLLDGA